MNIYEFEVNSIIQSIYSGKIYKIISDRNGMAKLLNLETGRLEDWNSCNNPHFKLAENQLKLF